VVGIGIGFSGLRTVRRLPIVRFRCELPVVAGPACRIGIYPSTLSKARKAVWRYCQHIAGLGVCGIAFFSLLLLGFRYRCLRLPLATGFYAGSLGQRYGCILDREVFWQASLVRTHIAKQNLGRVWRRSLAGADNSTGADPLLPGFGPMAVGWRCVGGFAFRHFR